VFLKGRYSTAYQQVHPRFIHSPRLFDGFPIGHALRLAGKRNCGNLRKVLALVVIGDMGDSTMERQGQGSPHPERMRCDHCRQSFGLILHRYFRMRFCSADCLKAYQSRLDELTMMKIQHTDLSLPN
jgi:hypothetical protein